MNFSTLAMLLLAWQLLGVNNTSRETSPQKPSINKFLSDETNEMIDCVGKLSSQKSSTDDKMEALFQIISNPTVMDLVGNLTSSAKNTEHANDAQNEQSKDKNKTQTEFVNDEGYRFENPSEASRDFFKPIDNIADAEIKNKLYWFYDNWYVKKIKNEVLCICEAASFFLAHTRTLFLCSRLR